MRISVFKAGPCKSAPIIEAAKNYTITLVEAPMNSTTASLATGSEVVCLVGKTRLDAKVLRAIAGAGVRVVLCDSPGNVDVAAAAELGVAVIDVSRDGQPSASEPCLAMAHGIGRFLQDAGRQLILKRENNGAESQWAFGTAETSYPLLRLSPGIRLGGAEAGE